MQETLKGKFKKKNTIFGVDLVILENIEVFIFFSEKN